MFRRWRVRHSYPKSIVEMVVQLEPIHGATALSRLLDIPTSVIYRWRTRHRIDPASRQAAMEAGTLTTLVTRCEALGFRVASHARVPNGSARISTAMLLREAPQASQRSRLPQSCRAMGRYVFDMSKERSARRVRYRMETARQAVDTQYFLDVDCRTLAETAQMSLHHFIRMFGDMFGMSPHQYLTRVRVNAAKRLLFVSHEPIEVIAVGVGFRSGASLNRAFRRIEGTSISTYCRTLKQGGNGRELPVSIPSAAASAFS